MESNFVNDSKGYKNKVDITSMDKQHKSRTETLHIRTDGGSTRNIMKTQNAQMFSP